MFKVAFGSIFGGGKPKYIRKSDLKPGSVTVTQYNPESEEMPEALGIDPKRASAIQAEAEKIYSETGAYSEVTSRVSAMCQHPNELAFAMYIVAKKRTDLIPRKTPFPENITPLRVLKIADEGSLHDNLGINNNRKVELGEIVHKQYQSAKDIVDVMEEVSSQAQHPNELFFMIWILSDIHHKNMSLGKLMSMIEKKGDQE